MKRVIIGERYAPKLNDTLKYHGFNPIWMPDNPRIDKQRLAGHVDLSVFKLNDNTLIVSEHLYRNESFVKELTNIGINILCATKLQTSKYPGDINLCAKMIGDKIIHKREYTDPTIKDNFKGEFININQGYSACMICALNSKAIITSDHGIANAVSKYLIDVLIINDNGIYLEGFDKGFIGGSSYISGNQVYFTGLLEKNDSKEEILNFISKYGMTPVFLTNMPVFDIGGAITIN